MTLKKNNETYAKTAERLSKMESDPLLLKKILSQLRKEMESDPKFIASQQEKQGQDMSSQQYGYGDFVPNDTTMNGLDLQYENYNMQSQYPGSFEGYGAPGGFSIGSGANYGQQFGGSGDIGSIPQNPESNSFLQDAGAFGMQSLPSIASGITNYIGNKNLQKAANKQANKIEENVTKTKAQQVTAAQYNLGRERANIRNMSKENRAAMNRAMAQNSGGSRGLMMTGMLAGATKNQQVSGRQLSSSYQKEGVMNQQAQQRAGEMNARLTASNNAANAQREMQAKMMADRWRQQAHGHNQGQYGAITGTMQDMQQIAAQNQMISSLGDRYGYERANWYTPNQRQINYTGRG